MTKDEAYQQYEETIAQINKQAYEARERARDILREQQTALLKPHSPQKSEDNKKERD